MFSWLTAWWTELYKPNEKWQLFWSLSERKSLNVNSLSCAPSSKLSDEHSDACRPRWSMQLWGDVCIHSACALESNAGGWAQLKDIWMRWNTISLNKASYQSHPTCAVLLVHTCAMCFNWNCYWQIFHCDRLLRSPKEFSFCIIPALCSKHQACVMSVFLWMDVVKFILKEGGWVLKIKRHIKPWWSLIIIMTNQNICHLDTSTSTTSGASQVSSYASSMEWRCVGMVSNMFMSALR